MENLLQESKKIAKLAHSSNQALAW